MSQMVSESLVLHCRLTSKELINVLAFNDNRSVPKQPNGYDCGVYVCKFEACMVQLLNQDFKYGDEWFKTSLVDTCDAFKFSPNNVALLRWEHKELIDALSDEYLQKRRENEQAGSGNAVLDNWKTMSRQ